MLRRPDGPSYEVVLDEVALRRLSAPPEVMHAQIEALVTAASDPKVTVRILPVDAVIYEVLGSGLCPASVVPDHVRVDPELPGQAHNRRLWRQKGCRRERIRATAAKPA